ncbi:hypothetical protein Tco_0752515 [Tanacetum coccineum]|uniref:Uncharacterized protein n=1 Tax=Tanacetum coccineum TaxID=301880 RepID=A0ABQ4Z720_9ASTR
MSDSEDSMVTYTEVSSPYEGLPWMLDDPYVQVVLQAPPSPDYVPGPKEPEQAPPLPDLVLETVYPEFMPPEDEVLPAEEQPLPIAASPTADSPGYVPESDPEEDPEEDDDEDPKEDPDDYPTDGGDDGDDEDESSDDEEDDDDDDVDIEGDKEEEEHTAPADSIVVTLPAVDRALSAEETKPVKIDEYAATPPPHPAYRVTARMSIRDEPPTPFWSVVEIARLLAIPLPLPSPLSIWSSPLPQIPSPSLPRAEAPSTSHPLPLPSPIVILSTRASVAMLRAAAPSTYILASRSEAPPSRTPPLLPIPLPTPSPPLLPPSTDRRADVGESSSAPTARPDGDFRGDYGFIATLDDEIMRDPERDVGYRITDTWDEMLVGMPGAPATNEIELGRRVTDLVTTVRQDTNEIYGRLDDAQTDTTVKDRGVAESRPQDTDMVDRGLEIDEDTTDTVDNTSELIGTR